MQIEIHSYDSVEMYAKIKFKSNTYLISIGDTDANPPTFLHKPEKSLRLIFDDINKDMLIDILGYYPTDSEIRAYEGYFRFFHDGQARRIAEFVWNNQNKIDVLICQCEQGQSRSAACAAAVAEFLYGTGENIFADERYSPNVLVYQKILEALKIIKRSCV